MAFVFTPPVDLVGATTLPRPHPGNSLWRHFAPNPVGRNIWIVGGAVTEREPDRETQTVQYEYLGSHIYYISAAERTLLLAAGYTVSTVDDPVVFGGYTDPDTGGVITPLDSVFTELFEEFF